MSLLYSLLKPYWFRQDPEDVHDDMIARLESLQSSSIGRGMLRTISGRPASNPVTAMGLTFMHPIGLAAGFDKNARCVIALQELGFSFVEIGTVTPRPQAGNPKPRLWRFPEARALVNALGFPGEGMRAVRNHLAAARATGLVRVPIGINLGKNADTPLEDAATDYFAVFEHLYDLGDYFVVNVSSPNTTSLRDLQSAATLRPLIAPLAEYNAQHDSKPLLVKIAPDLPDDEVSAIAKLTESSGIAGIIAGNTTVDRGRVAAANSLERGGLSGAPLYARTLAMTKLLRFALPTNATLIAAGGIETQQQVKEIVTAGANLAQIYTGFIYHGPDLVSKLTVL